jgi:ADP-ribosylglycohydrolase
MSNLPADYEERVYAGVLGKIIGVYLGRPFEGWTNQRIEEQLGEVNYYVHEKLKHPLVVSDDDISGTFTFLRALPDHLLSYGLTAEQIGKTWLNYLIEKKTILWWGGMGVSTEHTAYLRLKNGVPAPQSGSIELNGATVAEQIGAQIFIDGWAMVCPGDPERAVALAGKAASVSHDGEAVYGAQVVAAMEAQAFVETDISRLLQCAVNFIPRASLIYQMIEDLRQWHADQPNDWRATFRKIEEKWGYANYGGGCHMIPNHAIIILALLYGNDDFQRSLMIANTAGWDTDCNSGNVGCLLGIKNGLAGLDKGVDFRGPVADRMYLPSADGGRCITDAVRETYEVVNIARALRGLRPIVAEYNARFHFDLPGARHGFAVEDSPLSRGTATLGNVSAKGIDPDVSADDRMLSIHYTGIGPGRIARVASPTFLPPEMLQHTGYGLQVCPTLYSGQTVRARVLPANDNARAVQVRLFIQYYGADDRLEIVRSEARTLEPGDPYNFQWEVPDTGGRPIAEVGVKVTGNSGTGTLYLDWLSWTGVPNTVLRRPEGGGKAWRRAWVNAVDDFRDWGVWDDKHFALVQNEGVGLLYQGESGWRDYSVSAVAKPHLAESFGLVGAVRGLRRYVAVRLERLGEGGVARLILRQDDIEAELDEMPYDWELYGDVPISLTVLGHGKISARIGEGEGAATLSGDVAPEQARGAAGFYVHTGHVQYGPLIIAPAE